MTYLSNSIELFLGTKNDPNFTIEEFSADRCDIEPLERKSVPSWNKGIPDTEENKKSKSEKMKKYWTDDLKGKKSSDMRDYNKKHGTERYRASLLERYSDADYVEIFTKKMEVINRDVEKRNKASIAMKQKWQDVSFIEKMKHRKPGGKKPVSVCIDETTYDSVSDAVSKTGLSYHTVRKMAGLVK